MAMLKNEKTPEERVLAHVKRRDYVNAKKYDSLPDILKKVVDNWADDVEKMNEPVEKTGPIMAWVKIVYGGNVYEIEPIDLNGVDTGIFMKHSDNLAERLREAGCSVAEPMAMYD